MNFTLIDASGLLLAVLSYGVLLALPGAALAAWFGAIGFKEADAATKPHLAIVAGFALLPGVDSLVARVAGLDGALGLNLALAAVGLAMGSRPQWHMSVSRISVLLLMTWLAIVLVEWIDFDIGRALYIPYIAVDMVKHAATTQTIYDTGVPPLDPFFVRPERVSYYYFFYTLTALSQRLGGGLIDARAAVGGLAFWTGLGVYGLARLLAVRCGFVKPGSDHRLRIALLILLAASGLDIIYVLRLGLLQDMWLPDPSNWTDEVTGWFEALIWVPHHLTGMIAGFAGFMVLADGITKPRRDAARAIAMAALCFVSALGLSVWLTLAAVATGGLWFGTLLFEKRWRAAAILTLAGLLALLIAAPIIADLRAGRSAGIPIEFAVRAFSPVDAVVKHDPLRALARLVALPLNYFAEFGILFSGTLLFWRGRRWRDVHQNELARVLTLGAIGSLLLGSFLRSTFFGNNDLGWRVLMVAQIAGLVWTAVAFVDLWEAAPRPQTRHPWRLLPALPLVLIGLGYATTLYAMLSLRAYGAMPIHADVLLFEAHPKTDRALRVAYDWANTHLPATMVLQHNPQFGKRVVDFGLYSRNPVGVADIYGALYGATSLAVEQRLNDVIPIFTRDLPDADVRARAAANGIDALVVSIDDPVWGMPHSWVWHAKPIYEDARVRLVPAAGIGDRASRALTMSDQMAGEEDNAILTRRLKAFCIIALSIAGFYAAGIIIGFALLVALFKAGVLQSIAVLFFRGLAVGGIVFLITFGLLLFIAARWKKGGLSARDCFGAAILSLSFNICFLVVVPVTVDRSVSVFVLGEMNANPDRLYTADEMSALFTRVYTDDYQQIDRRLHEQALIGNVERAGESYRISPHGQVFIQASKWVAWLFDGDTRLVTPPAEPSRNGPASR